MPAFTNLTIFYNPLEVVAALGKKQKKEFVSPFEVVSSIVQSKLENEQTEKELAHLSVSIPVCYGGSMDLTLNMSLVTIT